MSYPNPHGPSCPWYDITEKVGPPNIKWCEETLCQWVSEPANTWSNIGYLIAGLLILYIGIKEKHNFKLKQFGPIIFFMGAMSLVYHLSNFYGTQILDFVGMFFFVGWALGMNLMRMGKLKEKYFIPFNLGYGTFLLIITHLMYIAEIKFQMLVFVSGLLIFATEIMANRIKKVDLKWFGVTIGTLVVAISFSISDGSRFWCHTENHGWFSQGHALWHWIAAIGMFTIYLHYAQPALNPQEK